MLSGLKGKEKRRTNKPLKDPDGVSDERYPGFWVAFNDYLVVKDWDDAKCDIKESERA
jgi:hypothetical protein